MLDDTKVETQKLQLEETDLRLKNSELRLEYSENVDKLTDKQKETEAAQKEADKWMMISDTANGRRNRHRLNWRRRKVLRKNFWERLMAMII